MKRWLAISVFCEITNQFPGCVNGKKYPIGNAEKHCKQTRTHVIKVIRIANLSQFEPFFKQGVKVLHLIRDPRGVMSSRVRLQKQQYSNFTHHATSYCNTAIADIMYIREQARLDSTHIRQLYHIVHNEDLAADPMKGMENFMGMSPDEKVRKWAKSQAIPARKHENRTEKEHGTWRRNPKATSTKWRNSIKYFQFYRFKKSVRTISICLDTMRSSLRKSYEIIQYRW